MTTRRIGATAIFDAVARQIGLREDLIIVWGPRAADLALSLAYHWLTTASNACYLFQSWAAGYLLPFDGEASAKDLTEFFTELGNRQAGRRSSSLLALPARTKMKSFRTTPPMSLPRHATCSMLSTANPKKAATDGRSA